MKKGIIFDLDGTLWDSSENVAAAYSEVMQRHGFGTLSRSGLQKLMGKTMDDIALALFPGVSEQEREALMDEAVTRENEILSEKGGIIYPNLDETLEILCERYSLYIVSNCQCGYIETFLCVHCKGKYFTDFECFGGTKLGKGQNISLVISRNCLDEALYVGDTAGDYEAAELAGIAFVHAGYGFGAVPQAKYTIGAFAELPEMADRIFGI